MGIINSIISRPNKCPNSCRAHQGIVNNQIALTSNANKMDYRRGLELGGLKSDLRRSREAIRRLNNKLDKVCTELDGLK